MTVYHKSLSQEKWNSFDRPRQILNIASELSRAKNNLHSNAEYVRMSIERALELIDLTINNRAQWSGNSLKEMLRLREALAMYYLDEDKSPEELRSIVIAALNFSRESSIVRF